MGSESKAPAAEPHRWAMLAGVWLIYYCFGMVTASMAPLIEPITRDLGIGHGTMGAILGAWPLVYIVSAAPCGALLDRFGPRRAMAAAGAVIALSCVFRGLAEDEVGMFLAVALFGLGGPLISVGAPKVISLWFAGSERGLAMGIYITGPALGNIATLSLTHAVSLPLLGGDWRAVLLWYGAICLLGAGFWLLVASHPASRAMERRLAAEPKRSQFEVFGELLRMPAVQLMLAMSVGIFFYNHGLTNWLPEILRGLGMDAVSAGFWASLPTAAGVAGSLLIPRLATPERRLRILLALGCCALLATLLIRLDGALPLGLGLMLQGVARGTMTTVAVLTLLELRDVGPRTAGAASGLFFSFAEIGGVAGPLCVGLLHDATGGFAAALSAMSAVALGLIGATALFGRLQRRAGGA